MTHEKAIKEMQERIDIGKRCYPDMVQEYIEALKMAISALEHDRWIPVTSKLPKYETPVLTCDKEGNIHIMRRYKGQEMLFGIGNEYDTYFPVIAWRPLPEPYHPQKLNDADEDTAQSGLQSAT